jgi:hypothetical protein
VCGSGRPSRLETRRRPGNRADQETTRKLPPRLPLPGHRRCNPARATRNLRARGLHQNDSSCDWTTQQRNARASLSTARPQRFFVIQGSDSVSSSPSRRGFEPALAVRRLKSAALRQKPTNLLELLGRRRDLDPRPQPWQLYRLLRRSFDAERTPRRPIGLPQQKSAQACMIARRRSKLSVRR